MASVHGGSPEPDELLSAPSRPVPDGAVAPDADDGVRLEDDVVVAITAVLSRAVLGHSRTGDAESARALLTDLHQPHVDKLVRAAAAGAIGVAFSGRPLVERKLILSVRVCARALCGAREPGPWMLLGALTLALFANAGLADDPGGDLLEAGEALRHIQQDRLAMKVLHQSLESGTLTVEQEARARELVSRSPTAQIGRAHV